MQIVLPLARPALATVAVLTFLTVWNDLTWPLIAINSSEHYTLQLGLATFRAQHRTQWAAVMAGNCGHAAGRDRVPARAAHVHPLPDLERGEGMSAPVSLERVTKVYDGEVRAVDDVSLDVGGGRVRGARGAVGLRQVDAAADDRGARAGDGGAGGIGERDVTTVPPPDRDIAMVFQNYALYPNKTVRRTSRSACARRKPREESSGGSREMSAMLGLEELMGRRPGPALGRAAPAGGDGPGAGAEPQAFLSRAAVQPRR